MGSRHAKNLNGVSSSTVEVAAGQGWIWGQKRGEYGEDVRQKSEEGYA